jgi:hypothetical protein
LRRSDDPRIGRRQRRLPGRAHDLLQVRSRTQVV